MNKMLSFFVAQKLIMLYIASFPARQWNRNVHKHRCTRFHMLHSIHNRRSISEQGRKEELVHSM